MVEGQVDKRGDFVEVTKGDSWARVVEEMAGQLQCFDNSNSNWNQSSY